MLHTRPRPHYWVPDWVWALLPYLVAVIASVLLSITIVLRIMD